MPRPKKAGRVLFTRLAVGDEKAFDALPGTESEKLRDLVHEALVASEVRTRRIESASK
jgi:hypothetical protein